MEIIDITCMLSSELAVWPGDQPFESHWTARMEAGSTVNIGAFNQSTHAGTHVDAPHHYLAEGAYVHELPLAAFMGPAVVIEVRDTERIEPAHLAGVDWDRFKRLLFKTRSSERSETRWHDDFAALAPESVDLLGARGVVLVGTDAPSVDPADSTALPAHKALARHGIVNLENLRLAGVRPGAYHLSAFPMKLYALDAAPVRAVLTPLSP